MRLALGRLLLVLLALVTLGVCTTRGAAHSLPHSDAPLTRRTYTLQVEQLPADPDAATATPVLISAVERTSMTLRLRPGHTCASGDWESAEGDGATRADLTGDANDLTFDDNFNPLWYFALRRRGFQNLEWSGCGGKWRPEWTDPSAPSEDPSLSADAADMAAVKHALSHHVVCTFSSVSFCAAARRRSAQSQFQWAAQFVSTLTSSPLSWRSNTPRHIRPTGVLATAAPHNDSWLATRPNELDGLQGRPLRAPSHLPGVVKTEALLEAEAQTQRWCSYHVAYHDTLCTQHISPVLNGGRSGSGVQEGLPPGLFKAVVPSLPLLFGTPLHQFHFRGHQSCEREGEVVLSMTLRMSFVVRREEDLDAVAQHWATELPPFKASAEAQPHNALHVLIGPAGVSPRFQAALAALEGTTALRNLTRPSAAHAPPSSAALPDGTAATAPPRASALAGGLSVSHGLPWEPEVRYKVDMAGKDHGFYTLEMVPTSVLSAALNVPHERHTDRARQTNADSHHHHDHQIAHTAATTETWRVGDVIRSLVLLPLHLLRPVLHDMESLHGSTTLEKVDVDTSANTIAMVLHTRLTAAHLAAYDEAYHASQQPGAAFHQLPGVLLARFPVAHGWAGSRDAPRDADSFRAVPQPVVSLTRCREGHVPAAPHAHGGVDHSEAIAAIMKILPSTRRAAHDDDGEALPSHEGSAGCDVMWLRSTMVSGTYIPAPDPAMLFNAFALGLAGFSLGVGAVARSMFRLFSREKDRESFGEREYEANWERNYQWRQQTAQAAGTE